MDPYEEWLSNDMQGDSDRPEATFIALVDGEVAGYAKLSLSRVGHEGRLPRHDRRPARVPRAGHRGGAEARGDRVGEAGRATRGCRPRNEVRNEPIRALNERHGYNAGARARHAARGAVRAGLS